jgi:hypothetical protein
MLPRRGYVLAVLAYTGIATVAAAVLAIYQLVEAIFDLGTAYHLVVRQAATVAVIVGIAALGQLLRLGADLRILHARQPALAPPSVGAAPGASADTLEKILHEAVAGQVEVEMAAARIRALLGTPQLPPGSQRVPAEHQFVARQAFREPHTLAEEGRSALWAINRHLQSETRAACCGTFSRVWHLALPCSG